MEPVEAGCTRCNQRFYLPVDKAGNPVWTHVCPKTTDERIEELTALVKDLAAKQDVVSETQWEILDVNQTLAQRTIRSAEDAASALRAASVVKKQEREK